MFTLFIVLMSFSFNKLPSEKILPPINNIYKTTINIPILGSQNIEYERIAFYKSKVRLNGIINEIGNIYIKKNNIYDYEFDDVLKKIIKKYKCELYNPCYNFEDDNIVIQLKIKIIKFSKKLILTNINKIK